MLLQLDILFLVMVKNIHLFTYFLGGERMVRTSASVSRSEGFFRPPTVGILSSMEGLFVFKQHLYKKVDVLVDHGYVMVEEMHVV